MIRIRRFRNPVMLVDAMGAQVDGEISAVNSQTRNERRGGLLWMTPFRLLASASLCFAIAGATAAEPTNVPSPICMAADLRLVIEAHGSPRGVGDRLMLRQALINLVDNAIKFAPTGTAVVIRIVESASHAVIDVVDRGPGIPAAARERIFDRFFRASSAPADVAGTGLGLSIAKSAVETSGGTLTLEHSDQQGTTFRITLPRG